MKKRKNFWKTFIYWATVGLLCFCVSEVPAVAVGTSAQYTKQYAKQLPPLASDRPEPTQPSPAIPARPQPQVPLINEDVEAFFDRTVTEQLDKEHIPRAAIAFIYFLHYGNFIGVQF